MLNRVINSDVFLYKRLMKALVEEIMDEKNIPEAHEEGIYTINKRNSSTNRNQTALPGYEKEKIVKDIPRIYIKNIH